MSNLTVGHRFLLIGSKLNETNAHAVLQGFLFWLANTSGEDGHYQKGKILNELLRLIEKKATNAS